VANKLDQQRVRTWIANELNG